MRNLDFLELSMSLENISSVSLNSIRGGKMKLAIMNNIDYKVGIYIRLSREDEEKEKISRK